MEKLSKIVETLNTYKKLTESQENHSTILADKTIILYIATLLENGNKNILQICLNILNNLVQNEKTHKTLLQTFGIVEALESLRIRLKNSSVALEQGINEILETLRCSAPPAYNTRSKGAGNARKNSFVYFLHVENLTNENRDGLQNLLVNVRGLISFVCDLERKTCTVRTLPDVSVRSIIWKIKSKCNLKATVMTKNPENSQIFPKELELENTDDYFPEDLSPIKENAVARKMKIVKPGNLLHKATTFFTESFYW